MVENFQPLAPETGVRLSVGSLFFNDLTGSTLGSYVQSTYIATKNRPNYIIESVFGFSEEEVEHIRKKPTGRQTANNK